jgi:ArsR family transcriptional regulator
MDPVLNKLAKRYKLLSDPTRLFILALLREKDLSVNEIVYQLNVSQPAISQQLKKLKAERFVIESRDAQKIYYHLNMEEISDLKLFLIDIPPIKTKRP